MHSSQYFSSSRSCNIRNWLILAARVASGEKREGVGTEIKGKRVTSFRHVTTRYLFIESFVDVAEVMRSKLQKTLQLLPGHLLHNKPVI